MNFIPYKVNEVLDNVFRLVGVGAEAIQKPFLLPNPMRMVFDMPNTIINPELHNTCSRARFL